MARCCLMQEKVPELNSCISPPRNMISGSSSAAWKVKNVSLKSASSREAILVVGWSIAQQILQFSVISGLGAMNRIEAAASLNNGQEYTSVVKVRKTGLRRVC